MAQALLPSFTAALYVLSMSCVCLLAIHLTIRLHQFKLKVADEYDVDIKIEACGVCGSDVHTVTGGWGKQNFPLCVGHGELGFAPARIPSSRLLLITT